MKIWQNVQLSQLGLGSTIARIHLSTVSLGSHIWSLLAPIHMKSWPKSKLYKVEVSSNICSKSLFPIHMKSWPKSKLYQVEVSSNICSKSLLSKKSCLVIGTIWSIRSSLRKFDHCLKHSSSLFDVISDYYWPQFIWKVDKKYNWVELRFRYYCVKLESVKTMLKITHSVIILFDF